MHGLRSLDPRDVGRFHRRTLGLLAAFVLLVLVGAPGARSQDTVTIVGEIYLDANGNRARDPGEPGIPGAAIQVYTADGARLLTAHSDREGYYVIGGLPHSNYTLVVEPPLGYVVLDNGTTVYRSAEVQGPVLVSTPLYHGRLLFLPLVAR